MGLLLIILAGAGLWAWRTGKLNGYTPEDGIAVVLFLLGLRLLTTGRLLIGAGLMAGALLWGAYRRAHTASSTMSVTDARRLLGVGSAASIPQIRDAHRRLIARVHPDVGGSAELANRVNVARDVLVAEASRRSPHIS